MFGNSSAYLETPLRRHSPPPHITASPCASHACTPCRPHFQTPSVPTPSLTFPSFTGGRTPGVFVTPGGGVVQSSGLGGDDNRCSALPALLAAPTRATGERKSPCHTRCCGRRVRGRFWTCCRCKKTLQRARCRASEACLVLSLSDVLATFDSLCCRRLI